MSSQPLISIKDRLLYRLDCPGPCCIEGFDKVNHSVAWEAQFVFPFWMLRVHFGVGWLGVLCGGVEQYLGSHSIHVWLPRGLKHPIAASPLWFLSAEALGMLSMVDSHYLKVTLCWMWPSAFWGLAHAANWISGRKHLMQRSFVAQKQLYFLYLIDLNSVHSFTPALFYLSVTEQAD